MNPEKKRKPDMKISGIDVEIKICAHQKNSKDARWLIGDYLKHPDRNTLHLWVSEASRITEVYAEPKYFDSITKHRVIGYPIAGILPALFSVIFVQPY